LTYPRCVVKRGECRVITTEETEETFMTVKSVAFQGKVYVERPGVGMPAGAISVEALMGPDAAE
jgi:hypothetical protein